MKVGILGFFKLLNLKSIGDRGDIYDAEDAPRGIGRSCGPGIPSLALCGGGDRVRDRAVSVAGICAYGHPPICTTFNNSILAMH